ncbi:hypothetical protein RRG08_019661 [Elysia crispata]|uniref:Ferritin n=1 Tax=Elysia crispata TaxID=231223 RepID=A0AAE1CVD7_9GAST|nr:hypothetical protein RRG08_019661 [Elysia crispata]
MLGGPKLLLLLAVLVLLVPLTDPRGSGNTRTKPKARSSLRARSRSKFGNCQKKIAGCGEFSLSDGAKKTKCKLNKRNCMFYCRFSCKDKMRKYPSSTKFQHKKDVYMCLDNEWQLPPRGYCIAESYPVQEVRQSSTYPERMNTLIKKLLTSGYSYLAMASFYRRADVALPGFVKLMTGLFEKDQNFAQDLISYLQQRGESLHLHDIERSTYYEDLVLHLGKRTGKLGLERALIETKSVNEYVLETINQASSHPADPHRRHFLEDGVLDYKVSTIKRLALLLHRLETFPDLEEYFIGEYSMDLELRE